jgi:glycine/D-amino acid oxidase-like deaminating enzyme
VTRDFIIVGQGIAGSVLALSLLKANYSVLVIDDPGLSSCSRVAAGIWNPVVFKRLTKSWLADDVVPELQAFYTDASKLLGVKLIRERVIIKPFTEQQEKNLWIKKAQSDNRFLDPDTYHHLHITEQDTLADYSNVLQAGNLEVKLFLEKTREYLLQNGSYLIEAFDHKLLQRNAPAILYKNASAEHIIFCEGHLLSKNPDFAYIPLKPAKGEVLTIRCEAMLLNNDILNKGIFILPLGDHTYKVGATYDWEDLSDTPTEAAKQTLIGKLKAVISVPFEVVAHEAGVRPAVIDRRPVVGTHPVYDNHHLFNGFGTKAVMLAPYFAKAFVASFRDGKPLDPEVDPNRFYKKSC